MCAETQASLDFERRDRAGQTFIPRANQIQKVHSATLVPPSDRHGAMQAHFHETQFGSIRIRPARVNLQQQNGFFGSTDRSRAPDLTQINAGRIHEPTIETWPSTDN